MLLGEGGHLNRVAYVLAKREVLPAFRHGLPRVWAKVLLRSRGTWAIAVRRRQGKGTRVSSGWSLCWGGGGGGGGEVWEWWGGKWGWS